MAKTNTTEILEALAADIGDNVYLDIAKWHLGLDDAHLHTVVAERVYQLLTSDSVGENQLLQILHNIPVKIGGGKRELPLADFIPNAGIQALLEVLEKYQRQL